MRPTNSAVKTSALCKLSKLAQSAACQYLSQRLMSGCGTPNHAANCSCRTNGVRPSRVRRLPRVGPGHVQQAQEQHQQAQPKGVIARHRQREVPAQGRLVAAIRLPGHCDPGLILLADQAT